MLAAAAGGVGGDGGIVLPGHAQAYQALSAQAALFHEQFVRALTAGARARMRPPGRQRGRARGCARRDQRPAPGAVGAPTDR
ncbi:PE family protein [Mycobacterium tuberculosis]